MRFLHLGKDGGPDSSVWGYWFIELKRLLSVVLLKFVGQSREVFHNHAFNSVSWVLRGKLIEELRDGTVRMHGPSLRPIITRRETFHKVDSVGTTWVFSLRGPWASSWNEYQPQNNQLIRLGKGRKVLA